MATAVDYFAKRNTVFGLRVWIVLCVGLGLGAILILLCVWGWRSSRRRKNRVFIQQDSLEANLQRAQKLSSHLLSTVVSFLSRGSTDHKQRCAEENQRNLIKVESMEDVEMSCCIEQDIPLRAYNLDKADREYKGKVLGRAKLAARGEDVRREIARRRMSEKDKDVIFVKDRVHQSPRGLKVVEEENLDVFVKDRVHPSPCEDATITTTSDLVTGTPYANSDLGWGCRYSLRELQQATNSFSDANVLGEGSHAIVYYGLLSDGSRIALRKLLNNGDQADKEFHVETEAIGRARHKNLVRLIGYCVESAQRMLIYEYIDNGNVEQWLHGPLGDLPPLSWDIRMKIIIGTAKGLAYLHEGLEPKVVHRDVKSSNILLDSQWNPKVSDFGLAKLLSAEHAHITTMVMGTFGYVAPEYASTGMLTEKSDVFSYGVLVMELVTGRVPVDINRKSGEENIVDWLKGMVSNRRLDEVVDVRIQVKPSLRVLKRVLLVALKCVDPDPDMRPKMSYVVHMLEAAEDASKDVTRNMIT